MIVTALSVAAVKGTRLRSVDQVQIDHAGARGDRRFFVVDGRDRMINAKRAGELQTVLSDCDGDRLRLTFPDGTVVEGAVNGGERIRARFFSRMVEGEVIGGAPASALSEHLGQEVRIVHAEGSVDRGLRGAVSLISRASLERLAEVAAEQAIDARRFRMLVEIDEAGAHEEDLWVGRSVRIGAVVVRFHGHVGRCLITSRDPDTGRIDLPTLDLLGSYRRAVQSTEPLPFGIYGEVVRPGPLRVGDQVTLA